MKSVPHDTQPFVIPAPRILHVPCFCKFACATGSKACHQTAPELHFARGLEGSGSLNTDVFAQPKQHKRWRSSRVVSLRPGALEGKVRSASSQPWQKPRFGVARSNHLPRAEPLVAHGMGGRDARWTR
jgi:hypothetical protein